MDKLKAMDKLIMKAVTKGNDSSLKISRESVKTNFHTP